MTAVRLLVPPERLRAAIGDVATVALDDMLSALGAGTTTLARCFPAAARRTARGALEDDGGGTGGQRIEDAVRVELVASAAAARSPEALLDELVLLYRHGDADEKRAVLLALAGTDDARVDGSEVLLDALRTNDVRLVAAAMGPHASHLSDHDWRHGVLKCLFVGVPLAAVAGLAARADDELTDMVRRFTDERRAAGRPVPDDAHVVLDATHPHPVPTGQEG
jgi:hypothetical protein